ncbi:metallophosphoesterase [Haloglomus litoreum]|uniref:metallophosphoesterase n=1 Tax=Haloglomus litoreum TaxID=3034026 RepID=UPI0023E89C42|nr:metallophosphoesterase [Haloglomus sp. DT116]
MQSARIDSVDAFAGTPSIVHISDVHGYLDEARSALLAVGESNRFDPVVTADADERLHWAGNDHVLVVNGDLVDRGPENEACLDLVWRLVEEAPPGRVRYHLGNHEQAILLPGQVRWPDAFSTGLDRAERRAFLERIADGDVTAAFEGYGYTYSHAGSNEALSAATVNDELRAAASELRSAIGTDDDAAVQDRLEDEYDHLFGLGETSARGPGAGLTWLDFRHLDPTAPPQIVGHSMQTEPVRKGNVVCGNVIRRNESRPWGEGVLVETPEELFGVLRGLDREVRVIRI